MDRMHSSSLTGFGRVHSGPAACASSEFTELTVDTHQLLASSHSCLLLFSFDPENLSSYESSSLNCYVLAYFDFVSTSFQEHLESRYWFSS